ncbi:transmembrane protein [Gossypium australe]|uniref:Transmembrane protein n=1 Tax=Gossypium australe TaxID=47621 RepID=A0A5B6W432_9ROSI|nr:transmembrane protein [Gossypium australe]
MKKNHWKPVGTFLEQTLRSKLRETGTLRLRPKTLALIAVQRQAAASRSTRPLRREQHGITGGEPTVTLTKLSTLAHTPNLRESLGHLPRADGVGVGHWKPVGTFLEQTLRSKLRETGMLRLMPKMLALIAVQRHAAASRSTRPLRREQHGITGGEPTVTLTRLSTLAHTPNLRASLGHLPRADGVGVGVLGFGFGLGLGVGEEQEPQAVTREKKRMLSAKRRTMEADLLEAILIFSQNLSGLLSWL